MIKLFIGVLIIFYFQNSHIREQISESMSAEIREYRVERVDDNSISIDGKLDESGWQDAAFTEEFVVHTNGAEPEFATKAQMLWDDHTLYIAFIVFDNKIWATMKKHDKPLWLEEAVEVFIDPDGDGRNYIELQANCLGTTLDLLMNKEFAKGGHTNYQWNLKGFTVGIDTVTFREKKCHKWICEMALPFESMLSAAPTMNCPPEMGDSWRINVCRIERDPSHRDTMEATCWNQTDKRGFHAPDKFGRIIFRDTVENK